jgi:L-ascorbate metabolism protein UlaG (beta-lactamase superfamily)
MKMIQAQHVIPAHYNTWPLIAQDPEAWKKRVETETDAVVHIMEADTDLDF